jgi:hypothetical protein
MVDEVAAVGEEFKALWACVRLRGYNVHGV